MYIDTDDVSKKICGQSSKPKLLLMLFTIHIDFKLTLMLQYIGTNKVNSLPQ